MAAQVEAVPFYRMEAGRLTLMPQRLHELAEHVVNADRDLAGLWQCVSNCDLRTGIRRAIVRGKRIGIALFQSISEWNHTCAQLHQGKRASFECTVAAREFGFSFAFDCFLV